MSFYGSIFVPVSFWVLLPIAEELRVDTSFSFLDVAKQSTVLKIPIAYLA